MMIRSKRLFCLITLLCLLLSLCACSAGAVAKDDAPAKDAGDAPASAGPAAPDEAGVKPAEDNGGLDFAESVDGFYYAGKSGGEAPAYDGDLSSGSIGAEGEGGGSEPAEPEPGVDPAPPEPDPETIVVPDPAQPLLLTAAEWKDNDNWPFFTNLVNTGAVAFPSFGLDPRNRIEVRLNTGANETVTLLDAEGSVLWTARSDKNGVAYLFWTEGQRPDRVVWGEQSAPVQAPEAGGDPQGETVMRPMETLRLEGSSAGPAPAGTQVMFILDTTGSMGDELAYLQKDFSAITDRVDGDVRWAVSFYRDEGDEYVTRHSEFTTDAAALQAKINAEYADGGGDTPEAVAQVLTECLTRREDWDENAVKLAFLIFDAPPHGGKDEELQAAVRAAAARGIRLIPVVASNAERDTELFGRALAILTGGTYVFLTDDSGIGESHLEPIVGSYTVEKLQDLIVRLIQERQA